MTDSVQKLHLHEGFIPLHWLDGRQSLIDGPMSRYPGMYVKDTGSPVQ